MTLGIRCFVLALLGCSVFAISSGSDKVPDWTPPKTTVAKELVDVGKFLLEHGMADPRGGKLVLQRFYRRQGQNPTPIEYRSIGWLVEANGQKSLVNVQGIAKPAEGEMKPIAAHDAVDIALKLYKQGRPFSRQAGYQHNIYSAIKDPKAEACSDLLTDQAIIMLLISGETLEAERLCGIRTHTSYEEGKKRIIPGPEPITLYEILDSFVKSLWDQAVYLHRIGQDAIVADTCRTLIKNRKAYEAYADSLPNSEMRTQYASEPGKASYTFLNDAPVLLADSQRRQSEGKKKVDLESLKALPQQERILRLIDYLDEAKNLRWDQSNDDPYNEPILAAVIAEDVAIGDALLDCAEKDTRLTRCDPNMYYGFAGPTPMTVRAFALWAFTIISTLSSGVEPNAVQPNTILQLRAKWQKYRLLTTAGRWIENIKDDSSSASTWVYSARRLAYLDQLRIWRETHNIRSDISRLTSAEVQEMVSLCLSRADQIEMKKFGPWRERYSNHSQALKLLVAANQFDTNTVMPRLVAVVALVRKESPCGLKRDWDVQLSLASAFAAMIDARVPAASQKYLEWLMAEQYNDTYTYDLFKPLEHLEAEQAEKLVQDLFSNPRSTLAINSKSIYQNYRSYSNLLSTSLPCYHAFRSAYLGLLGNRMPIGEATVRGSRMIVRLKGMTINYELSDSRQKAAKFPVRACDYYANEISVFGLPKFDLSWPVAKRDATIKEIVAYLKRHWRETALRSRALRV